MMLAYEGTNEMGIYYRNPLAVIPEEYGRLRMESCYYQCAEGNWSWQVEMVDTGGIVRASYHRDCSRELFAMVDDRPITIPASLRADTRSRESVKGKE